MHNTKPEARITRNASDHEKIRTELKACSHFTSDPTLRNIANGIVTRVGVNSGIEWELSSIPDSIPEIGLGIGIEK